MNAEEAWRLADELEKLGGSLVKTTLVPVPNTKVWVVLVTGLELPGGWGHQFYVLGRRDDRYVIASKAEALCPA